MYLLRTFFILACIYLTGCDSPSAPSSASNSNGFPRSSYYHKDDYVIVMINGWPYKGKITSKNETGCGMEASYTFTGNYIGVYTDGSQYPVTDVFICESYIQQRS